MNFYRWTHEDCGVDCDCFVCPIGLKETLLSCVGLTLIDRSFKLSKEATNYQYLQSLTLKPIVIDV
jgi:hypothetical protein